MERQSETWKSYPCMKLFFFKFKIVNSLKIFISELYPQTVVFFSLMVEKHVPSDTHISKALVPLTLEVQLFKGVLTSSQHHVHQYPKGEHVCLYNTA